MKKNLFFFKKILPYFLKKLLHCKTISYSMDQPREDILKNVWYSASLYFYSHPLEGFYTVYIENIDASFVFLLQKDFYIAHESIVAFFCLFLLQKVFYTFHLLLFGTFPCFFIIVISLFIHRKKVMKKILLIAFFYTL